MALLIVQFQIPDEGVLSLEELHHVVRHNTVFWPTRLGEYISFANLKERELRFIERALVLIRISHIAWSPVCFNFAARHRGLDIKYCHTSMDLCPISMCQVLLSLDSAQ